MLTGTPAFGKKLSALIAEFDDESGKLSFLFGFRQFEQTTARDPHRWPLFDIRKGVATYRAVIGLYAVHGRLHQYVVFFQKLSKGAEVSPLLLWVAKVDETDRPV